GTRCEYSQRLILNGNRCMYCFYMQGQQHADKFRYQPTNSDSYDTSRERGSASRTQIREFRDVYENFYSKFNLHHFPTDIQDLSVSIVSALFDTEVILKVDLNRIFGINREAFTDQQEWKLYDHVEIQTKFIKGYLFQNDNDYELDTPGHERKRLILTMTCHAAARRRHMEELDKLYRQLVDQRLCKDRLSAKQV
ncbi:unnamed protein product, partial [Rotaria sp. Silwood1]